MKKTAKEWFEQLPEPYRTQALENCTAKGEEDSLSEAIFGGFIWSLTPQGYGYWSDIKLRAIRGEFDKPIPNLHNWIPVGERLPTNEDADENGDVLVLGIDNIKRVYFYDAVRIQKDNIKFWQPLPKLPEKL
jgi:hypothetical protein